MKLWNGVVPWVAVAAIGLAGCSQSETLEVPSDSMAPTFRVGDEIEVVPDGDFEVGDVVTLHPPSGSESGDGGADGLGCGAVPKKGQPCPSATPESSDDVFIKRIVAGPGDTVAIESGLAVVNGELETPDGYEPMACDPVDQACDMPLPITVPDDSWFLLGDNRGQSDDSRFWGPIPSSWVIATVED